MNEELLIKIARTAIESNFEEDVKVKKKKLLKEHPFLGEQKACFVTLSKEGHLRGCIGSLVAQRSLIDDLIHNAIAAAIGDPRFVPLTKEEFENIAVEVSVLTDPEDLEYEDFEDLEKKLIPFEHGVILELDGRRATFLPQVWEQLPDFQEFMISLCRKAGLDPTQLSALPKIQTYKAIKFKEA